MIAGSYREDTAFFYCPLAGLRHFYVNKPHKKASPLTGEACEIKTQ